MDNGKEFKRGKAWREENRLTMRRIHRSMLDLRRYR